jgi:hypothetical protein
MEQTLNLRRPPFSTPALIAGKAPASRSQRITLNESGNHLGELKLDYDGTTAALNHALKLTDSARPQIVGIWIHRGEKGKPGAALHQIYEGPGTATSGRVTLSFSDRRQLEEGRLSVRVYTRTSPAGGGEIQIGLR